MSVSVTTRSIRPGEIEGRDYCFTDAAGFASLVANGELLEHATVFGNSYGTPQVPVEAALAAGRDVLFDIDWQGNSGTQGKDTRRFGDRVRAAALRWRTGAASDPTRGRQLRGYRRPHGKRRAAEMSHFPEI